MRWHKRLLGREALAAGSWGLVVYLLVKALEQASFGGDDAHLIQLASSLPFWHFLVNPEAYQLLSVAHFTPLVPGLYQGVLWLAGVNPAAFLLLQLLLLTLTLGSLLWWLGQQTQQRVALWVFCLALIALGSLPSFLLRNYTQHYTLGGLLAVFCLLALYQRWFILSLVGFLFAILSKEIYLPLFGFLVLYALYKRNFSLLGFSLALVVVYFAFRGWHLGVTIQGRDGTGMLAGLLTISLHQWFAFAQWYLSSHVGLLLLALLALAFNPYRFLLYALLAGLFLTPLLAAPHAILQPAFHADRLLYPFHLGLAVALALALGQAANARGWFKNSCLNKNYWFLALPVLLIALLLRLVLFSPNFPAYEAQERIYVQQLLDQLEGGVANKGTEPLTLLVPVNFKMGALMDAYATFEPQRPVFELTLNCFDVLKQAGPWMPVAEFWKPELQTTPWGAGWVALSQLEQQCQPLAGGAEMLQVIKPMTFAADSSLSWQAKLTLPVDGPLQAGIYFTERNLFIGTLSFSEHLVRPFPNEPYVWVLNLGQSWWFSEPQEVVFE